MALTSDSQMALGERFPPDHRFLYKPIPEVENGEGCFVDKAEQKRFQDVARGNTTQDLPFKVAQRGLE